MTWITGIIGSIIAAGIVALIAAAYQRWFGQKIQITHPRPGEALTDPAPLGQIFAFPVHGKLKRLPKDHEIWLLNQEEQTGLLGPQGFSIVKYNHENGTWTGKVCSRKNTSLRLVAVVAPPTTQDFFRYYQHVGEMRGYTFELLKRIPPECKNVASIQTFVP